MLAVLEEFLADFADQTLILQESRCTLSMVAQFAFNLQQKFTNASKQPHPLVREMLEAMRKKSEQTELKLSQILEPTSVYIKTAAIDPRFKVRTFVTDATWKALEADLAKIISPDSSNTATRTSALHDKESPAVKRRRTQLTGENAPCSLAALDAAEILTDFRRMRNIDENADPFKWWAKKADDFPELSKLAARFLIMQPTEVPSERLFSAAGRIFNDFRARLHHTTLDILVRIHENDPLLQHYRQKNSIDS